MALRQFHNFEKFIFKIVVLLSALPVLLFEFYPTMDGAAHLYNSNLIWSLLFDNHETIQQFYELNSEPVPNWTGHFLLAIFNSFLPAHIADSAVLLFCVVGLPLAFRRLLKTIEPANLLLSYLIFPFVYSFTLTLGFYNFSIALVLLFFTLSYWLQSQPKRFSWKILFILFLLITATYFSHLFVFGILLLLLGLNEIYLLLIGLSSREVGGNAVFKGFLSKTAILVSASCISLILFAQYLFERPYSDQSKWLTNTELIEDLTTIGPIISYNSEIEEPWTKLLFYLLILVLAVALFIKFKYIFQKNSSEVKGSVSQKIFTKHSFWLIATLVLITLYFMLPDSDGYAGYISTRIALLFFMFFILWLATTPFSKWFMTILACVSLFITFKFVRFYGEVVKPLNEIALNCVEASDKLAENSVVLPINLSDHWLLPHFSNYLGAEKPVVILENYEASTGYFPVKWNEKSIPNTLLDGDSVDVFECLYWKSEKSGPSVNIDYVFLLGTLNKADACHVKIQMLLESSFQEVYSKGRIHLHKRRR